MFVHTVFPRHTVSQRAFNHWSFFFLKSILVFLAECFFARLEANAQRTMSASQSVVSSAKGRSTKAPTRRVQGCLQSSTIGSVRALTSCIASATAAHSRNGSETVLA